VNSVSQPFFENARSRATTSSVLHSSLSRTTGFVRIHRSVLLNPRLGFGSRLVVRRQGRCVCTGSARREPICGAFIHVPLEAEQGRTPIFIAPLRNGVALGESEWIQVTDGTGTEAAPWWSPDGNILYFLSQRDGFQCIWAQHLDKATKRPAGAPFDVAHFHGARRKVQEAGFGPGIGVDKLVFALSESTGNIWMAQLGAQK
jgi:WD40 repeat protein